MTINKIDFDPDKHTLFAQDTEVPETPTLTPGLVAEPLLAALELINTATEPDELTPLPSIGLVSARAIFDNRPTNGYGSLEAVAALDGLSRVDWDAVEAWEG